MPSLLSRVFGNLLLFSIVGGTNRYTNKLPASFSPPALQDLFISGQSTNPWTGAGTNVCYRIPSLLRLGDSNTLLAIASERLWELSETSFCSDEAGSNIVLRRSEDGGETWSDMELLIPTGDNLSERHSFSLFDASTSTAFVFSNPDVTKTCNCTNEYYTSKDGGRTWSDPVFVDPDESGVYGMGLGHGIQHSSGRLVAGMRHICRNSCPADFKAKSIFSDDNGETWSSSDWLTAGTTENELCELSDGTLYINMRPYQGWEGQKDVRLVAYSGDRGSTWGEVKPEPALIDFGFADEGSVASDPKSNQVFFLHPHANDRSNLTLYYGHQDEATGEVVWEDGMTTVYEDEAEYSDMEVLDPGAATKVGVLFERDSYDKISFGVVHTNTVRKY